MSRITVTLACGCAVRVDEAAAPDKRVDPTCPTHGDQRVARVAAPAPRFRGHVLGPCAETDRTLKAV